MSETPSFPPLFTGHRAPPGADPMALAIAEAANDAAPGLLVWSPDLDRLSAALVLAPECPLEEAMAMTFAAAIGLFDIASFYINGYRYAFPEMDVRVAFMLDRVFQIFGLHGSSVMAYIVSGGIAGGCAVPGVMATRTLHNRRQSRRRRYRPSPNCRAARISGTPDRA